MVIKKTVALLLCVTLAWSVLAQETVSLDIKSTEAGGWSSKPAKVLDKIANFKPSEKVEQNLNRYGSSLHIKLDSTGFFHTAKVDGRWMLVDPDGYAYINSAVTSLYNMSGGVLTEAETQAAYDRLWELGFTGIGNFTDAATSITYNAKAQNASKQFSYTRAINFYLTYKNQRRNYYPTSPSTSELGNSGLNHIFVLDPAFVTFCVSHAASMVNYRNERNLLGYFTDNEINFNQDQLYNILNDITDEDDPSYKAALAYATSRGKTKAQIIAAGKPGWSADPLYRDFATLLAERYFKITDSVMKLYDVNHLNLGSRFHGRPRAIEGVVKAAGKYCDVVSANFYDNYCPDDEITSSTKWEAWIDKPVILGEFYVKGTDAKNQGYVDSNDPGAGWIVKTQADRGVWFHNTFIECVKSRNVVGWHYFKYRDGSDGANKGLYAMKAADASLTNSSWEYNGLASAMSKINKQRYNVLRHFYPTMLDTVVKKITDFSVAYELQAYQGSIEGHSITIDLPNGADASELYPTFSVSPSNAKIQVNGAELISDASTLNGVMPVVCKFMSRNYFDTVYTVNVQTIPTFKQFGIMSNWKSYAGEISGNNIKVIVPKNADPNALVPEFELSPNAKAYVDGEEQHSLVAPMVFSIPVTYQLKMPNGIENAYTVAVQFGEQTTSVKKSVLGLNVFCKNKTLYFSDVENNFDVKVFNMQGICIENKTLNSSSSLPLSQSGIFFVEVRQGEKSVVKKIIVN